MLTSSAFPRLSYMFLPVCLFVLFVFHVACYVKLSTDTDFSADVGIVGFNVQLATHYRSFRRRFYKSDDPTNSVIALKDDSLPGQGPIPQAQRTKS